MAHPHRTDAELIELLFKPHFIKDEDFMRAPDAVLNSHSIMRLEREKAAVELRKVNSALETAYKRIEELEAALEFYADPENYHAIAIWPDRPSGAFADDFSDDHGHEDYDRPMPGKLARAALTQPEPSEEQQL